MYVNSLRIFSNLPKSFSTENLQGKKCQVLCSDHALSMSKREASYSRFMELSFCGFLTNK